MRRRAATAKSSATNDNDIFVMLMKRRVHHHPCDRYIMADDIDIGTGLSSKSLNLAMVDQNRDEIAAHSRPT